MIRPAHILILIGALALSGCAAPAPQSRHARPVATVMPPLPPMPATPVKARSATSAMVAVAPPPQRTLTLTASAPVQVEASGDLQTWTLLTNALPAGGLTLTASGSQFFRGVLTAGNVTLLWMASDGGAAGYKIYYGGQSRHYTGVQDVGQTNGCVISVPAFATNYFAVTGYDVAGLESDFSNEAVWSFPPPVLTLK